jgi:hypothetical protein
MTNLHSLPPPEDSTGASPAYKGSKGSALIITNIGKVLGMATFFNEVWIKTEARNSVLILCGIFVLGVQVVENVALRLIDRFFGGSYS